MKQMDHEHINTALLSSIHGDTVTAYNTTGHRCPNYDTHLLNDYNKIECTW